MTNFYFIIIVLQLALQSKSQTPQCLLIPKTSDYYDTQTLPASSKATNWMGSLPDSKLISALSIPGTHNSASNIVENVFMSFWASCQSKSITDQLEMGVRYLDARARISGKGLALHHDVAYLGRGLRFIVSEMDSFLKRNPKECILLSVRQEEAFTDNFQEYFKNEIKGYEKIFYLRDIVPTLGEVRGKIVLIRRFKGTIGVFWDNIGNIHKFDEFNMKGKDKLEGIDNHTDSYRKSDKSILYITFVSFSGGVAQNLLGDREPANKLTNRHIFTQIGALGVIVMNYPATNLVRHIIDQNSDSNKKSISNSEKKDGNPLACTLENNSNSTLTLVGKYLPHGDWVCEPPAVKVKPGENTTWAAHKRAELTGTTAIVVYTDGKNYFMFGASHPRSSKAEIAVSYYSFPFKNEDAAHDAYNKVKTKDSQIYQKYLTSFLERSEDNIVRVQYDFKGLISSPRILLPSFSLPTSDFVVRDSVMLIIITIVLAGSCCFSVFFIKHRLSKKQIRGSRDYNMSAQTMNTVSVDTSRVMTMNTNDQGDQSPLTITNSFEIAA